jgi:predicted SnoaL-like aldol condensation-catalyzing enzyme
MIDGHEPSSLRQRVGMQRTSATEGDQRVVARVVALLDRHEAQRADHVLVDDVVDALGRVLDGQPSGVATFFTALVARSRSSSMSPPSFCISGR